MQVNSVTVNAAGLAPKWGIQGNRPQMQEEQSLFGAECKVTISREGKDLSRQQTARRAQGSVQDAETLKAQRQLRREEAAGQKADIAEDHRDEMREIEDQLKKQIEKFHQEEEKKKPDIRDKYRQELDEIVKQLDDDEGVDLSEAYIKIPRNYMDDEDIAETVGKQLDVLRTMRNQKDSQKARNERLAKEAQEMAMKAAGYQEEVDENNRDLLVLLKTMKEAEKAEDEREGGASEGNGAGSVSAAADPTGGMAGGSDAQFLMSCVEQVWGAQEAIAGLGDEGRQNMMRADGLIRSILDEVDNIRASMDDDMYSDEQITEMMERLKDAAPKPGLLDALKKHDWEFWKDNKNDIVKYKFWGLQNIEDAHEAKLEYIQMDPLNGMQQAKQGRRQAAIDADIGEVMQSGLDKASQELADEVEELIDERNDVDRIRQEREEVEEEQEKKAREQEKEEESDGQAKKSVEPWLGTAVDILL